MATPRSRPQRNSGNPVGIHQSRSPQQLHDRRVKAVELRVHGWSYDEIAKELGVSQNVARADVQMVLSQVEQEKVPELRAIESTRLDIAVYNALSIIARNPGTEISLKATDRLLTAIRVRAGLFGLNAPVEVQLIETTEIDQKIAALIAQLEEQNAQTQAAIVDGAVVSDDGVVLGDT